MQGIYEPNNSFNFNHLNCLTPTVISGGNYFIKFRINNLPLYIQPPKCKTKQSIIKTGKRMHCDLMFNNENEEFIKWMEDLEGFCQKKIFENRTKWFETELDEQDIENSFTSPLKIYKSGKFYICRTFVPTVMGVCSLKIYNEHEQEVSIENIQENSNVMTILEIQGIKCSAKNFQIDIELKQMMVLQPVDLFERCIFKHKSIEPDIQDIQVSKQEHILEEPEEHTFSKEPELRQEREKEKEDNNEDVLEPIDNSTYEQNTNNQRFENREHEQEHEQEHEHEEKEVEKNEEKIEDRKEILEQPSSIDGIVEVDFNLENLPEETVQIKKRNHIYYELYKEAKKKAKTARDLALSSYLEAKRIKNTYLLDENESDESDLDENFTNLTNPIN